MNRLRFFAAVAITAVASATVPVAAQTQNNPQFTDTQNSGNWTVHCFRAKQTICEMVEVMVERNTNVKVASVAINYVPKTESYFGRFSVPLGVAFDPGLDLEVGTFHAPNLRFGICAKDGCYVTGLLPPALIDAMKDTTVDKGAMRIQMINGRKVGIPIALNGFASGLEVLKKWTVEKASEGDKSAKK